MILKIKRYLSVYNEYYEVRVEGAYINIKLRIGNREQEIGNREPGTSSLFLILVCNTNISKVQIGNKEPVPGSFLTIILFILVSGYVYFISM